MQLHSGAISHLEVPFAEPSQNQLHTRVKNEKKNMIKFV